MNRPQRNHNPGNLRFAGQREAIGKELVKEPMAIFANDPAGFRALHAQIIIDADRGKTLEEFIYKYAPPEENRTKKYVAFVCRELKESPLVKLNEVSIYALAGVIAKQEGYYEE